MADIISFAKKAVFWSVPLVPDLHGINDFLERLDVTMV